MKDNRKFNQVVHDIRQSARDVDKVMDAAGVSRCDSNRLTARQKMEMIQMFMAGLAVFAFSALMFGFIAFLIICG
jgi:hypothetical protein